MKNGEESNFTKVLTVIAWVQNGGILFAKGFPVDLIQLWWSKDCVTPKCCALPRTK